MAHEGQGAPTWRRHLDTKEIRSLEALQALASGCYAKLRQP
jgi:hypothetical protein